MKHNKKRNSGLLYEFLTRHAAEGLVENDEKKVRQSIKLLRRAFKEGTELHREFRLFRALIGTCIDSKETAHRIIETTRRAAAQYDLARLDHEKSLLIRSINHTFGAGFYDKHIDEYRLYATVQTLLNEWRRPVPSDVVQVALYEEDLVEHLVAPKQRNILDESRDEVDDLVVGLMVKRVDGKARGVLDDEQMALMNSYVYSLKSGEDRCVREAIEKLRTATLSALDSYSQSSPDALSTERVAELRGMLSEAVTGVDDRVLARYLRVARLRHEMEG